MIVLKQLIFVFAYSSCKDSKIYYLNIVIHLDGIKVQETFITVYEAKFEVKSILIPTTDSDKLPYVDRRVYLFRFWVIHFGGFSSPY